MVISELLHAPKRFLAGIEWLKDAKFFDRVDSTQKRILQYLPKEADGAVLVIAEAQSKGTGRNGRKWHSPPGGIWFSFAMPMGDRDLASASSFSIVASYLTVKALKEVNNLECELKWPNDVISKGKKLGGVLSSTVKKFKKGWFVVGIGINVNNEIPDEIKDEATSIKIIRGQSQGRSRLIEAIFDSLWTAWQDYPQAGFGAYKKGIESCLTGVGKPASILMGSNTSTGTMEGIDLNGNLLLKSGNGTTTIQAGEVVTTPTK